MSRHVFPGSRFIRHVVDSARVLGAVLTLVAAFGCQKPSPVASHRSALGDDEVFPTYNNVYGIATHNSYWMNRSDQWDLHASGAQELLSDQFLHEHIRAIELDIHSEGAPQHEWKVYHTSDSEDFTCRHLSDCVEYLRNFHYAVPEHDVINIVIELKNTVSTDNVSTVGLPTHYNFASDHTIEDLDAILRNGLGDTLYTPADFYRDNNCDPSVSLGDCARSGLPDRTGWRTIDKLRGKFIINVVGNWSTAAYDWVQYANSDMQQRVAFPMASLLFLGPSDPSCYLAAGGGGGVPDQENAPATWHPTLFDGQAYCLRDIDVSYDKSPWIDPVQRQTAFDQAIFWQAEDNSDFAGEVLSRFLAKSGIARGGDSFEFEPDCTNDLAPENCQDARIRKRIQFVQTDYPWHFVDNTAWDTNHIPTDPSVRLKELDSFPDAQGNVKSSTPPHHEPGSRLYFQTSDTYPGAWAFATVPNNEDRWWEATVSTTRNGDTWGAYVHDLFVLEDRVHACPHFRQPEHDPDTENSGTTPGVGCTSYYRTAKEGGEGCIVVSSDDEGDRIEICRQKNNNPADGPNYYQERVELYIRAFEGGQKLRDQRWSAARYSPCKRSEDPNSGEVSDTCIGSMVGVAVHNTPDGSVVTVYSAGKLGPADSTRWLPQWHSLGSATFKVPMTKQGYRGWKSQLFAGLRTTTNLQTVGTNDWRPDPTDLHQISGADLPNQELGDPSDKIVDLSFHTILNSSTSVSLFPHPNAYAWIGASDLASASLDHVNVTLTAPSPVVFGGANLDSIDYSLSGAQGQPDVSSHSNPTTFGVRNDGVTNVSYFATDRDGNAQRAQSAVVRIDTQPPTINASISPGPNCVLSPPPNCVGWNNTPVVVSFSCADATSGVRSCASAVSLATEGANQLVSGAAQDYGLNNATAFAVANLDFTPPVVSYSGNAGPYTVDQSVSISCSASDALSGVAANSCAPINGPAYAFNIGLNTFSFSAMDFAGNSASAQTSFEVRVTFASLCNLTRRFSTKGAIADSLCTKLDSAAAAPNKTARDGKLNAYMNAVNAQAGKAIAVSDATVLDKLAAYLF